MSPQRQRALTFLALHGAATTIDVADVIGVRRLTAHRDLAWLHEAGLVSRWRSDHDPSHAWWYETTSAGAQVVADTMVTAGRQPPPRLGVRAHGAGHFLMFLPLVRHAAAHPETCALVQWRTTMETSLWLRRFELAYLGADGSGTWAEGTRAVRFLLHVDRGPGTLANPAEQHRVGVDTLVEPYRRGGPLPPVAVVLLVLASLEREQYLLAELRGDPLPVLVATSTVPLLAQHSPAESVWSVAGTTDGRRRLVDLAAGNQPGSQQLSEGGGPSG